MCDDCGDGGEEGGVVDEAVEGEGVVEVEEEGLWFYHMQGTHCSGQLSQVGLPL